ncbi:MAG: GspE/PulE family protein, partial [Caldimicrobium sp.]
MEKKPLGVILKEKGLITDDFINFALLEQKVTGEKLGEVLIRIGAVTDLEVAKALSEQTGFSFIDITTITPHPKALELLPFSFAKNNLVLPLSIENGTLNVAISDPFNLHLLSGIERITGRKINIYICGAQSLSKGIEKYYYFKEHSLDDYFNALIERLRINPNFEFNTEELLNNILILGISKKTTDLHLVPTSKSLQIFYRLDGILEPYLAFPYSVYRKLINIIKIRAQLDIAETRRPQDGRFSFTFLGSKYDLRVATAPTSFGEIVVIRYLPTGAHVQNLEYLGFDPDEVRLI